MTKITLKLQKRNQFGKKVKRLRDQGQIVGNVFGKGVDSLAVIGSLSDFQAVHDKAGETQVVYLQVEGENKERPTLLVNVQYHPVSGRMLHVDFHQVDLSEKVTANIPVELIGESPAVKEFNAVVVPAISEIEVEALPTDLLEKIEVNISVLKQIGDTIKVSDLPIDRTKLEVITDPDTIVVHATPQQEEEVAPAPAPEAEAAAEPTAGAAAPTEPTSEPTKSKGE